jgi:hypothetical protein
MAFEGVLLFLDLSARIQVLHCNSVTDLQVKSFARYCAYLKNPLDHSTVWMVDFETPVGSSISLFFLILGQHWQK